MHSGYQISSFSFSGAEFFCFSSVRCAFISNRKPTEKKMRLKKKLLFENFPSKHSILCNLIVRCIACNQTDIQSRCFPIRTLFSFPTIPIYIDRHRDRGPENQMTRVQCVVSDHHVILMGYRFVVFEEIAQVDDCLSFIIVHSRNCSVICFFLFLRFFNFVFVEHIFFYFFLYFC